MRQFKKCAWCGYYSLILDRSQIHSFTDEIKSDKKANKKDYAVKTLKLKWVNYEMRHFKQDWKCSYCGESLLDMNVKTDDELIAFGHGLYEEFKEFMSDENVALPDKIDIRLNPNGSGGVCDYDKEKKMFYVEICPYIDRHDIPNIFYHEFAHVAQLYDPETGGMIDKDKRKLFLNEYEASAIQTKKMLGFQRLNEDKKLSLKSKLIYHNKILTISEFFDTHRDEESIRVQKENLRNLTMGSLANIARAIIYYLGKLSVLKNHISDSDYKSLANIDKYQNILLEKVECANNEEVKSFKEIEKYIICSNGSTDEDKLALYNIIFDVSTWLIKHIPSTNR